MSPEQKRNAVLRAYPGGHWANKVNRMTDAQIHTIYIRLLDAGKLNNS